MNATCLTPQLLDRYEHSPQLREHVQACARCFALAQSHRQFLSTESLPGADVEDAERRLGDALERYVATAPQRARRRRRALEPLAWLAAAAAVVLIAILPRPFQDGGESTLREATPAPLQLLSPQPAGAGWLLRWDFVEAADSYELRLYTVDLEEIARYADIEQPQFALDEAVADGALWRVYAYHDGELVAMSAVGTLGAEP